MTSRSADIDRMLRHAITDDEQLEEVLGVPHPAILTKHTAFTTPRVREFIRHARFFVLATSDADGNCDSSPRGDVVTTVLFPDDHTIVLPDRPGNRRADSYRNILANPHVGILFVVPGIDEVVRVNGRATLTTDPDTLSAMSVRDTPAGLGVVVRIDQVYVHCARAILRSTLFDPSTWPDPDNVPTARAIGNELKGLPDPGDGGPTRQDAYRQHLY